MTERISATSLTPSTSRVRAEDLTDLEREALASRGAIGPEGFADIEKPPEPAMVDLKASERKKAVEKLNSVVKDGPPAVPPSPSIIVQEVPDLKKYTDEIDALRKKLDSRSPCPRCGLGIDESCEVVPTDADLSDFLTCVLGGEVFTKEYRFFNGSLVVVFRSRLGAEEEAIRGATTLAMQAKEITTENDVFAMIKLLTLATSLREYRPVNRPAVVYGMLPLSSPAEFKREAETRVNAIPVAVQSILRQGLKHFNQLVDLMSQRAQDPSFWQGTPALR